MTDRDALPGAAMNQVVMTGTVSQRSRLRYTPAGLPVLELLLQHDSRQTEAGGGVVIRLDLPVVAIGDIVATMDAITDGTAVKVKGFLANRSARSTQPILHLQAIRILELSKE
jgi:primosomal replication protein N